MVSNKEHQVANIYFTLINVDSHKVGFTDILMRWSTLYKLGTSLNYTYVHKPIICQNSTNVYYFLGFNDAFKLKINNFLNLDNKLKAKAYYKRYFTYQNNNSNLSFKDLIKKNINIIIDNLFFRNFFFQDIIINENLLKKNNITNLRDLQKYITNLVASYNTNKKILLRFQLGGARKEFYALINSELPNFPDQLNLRKSYCTTRKKQPCKTKFSPDKIKLLVHIRQGDTAFIETPWNTYIPVYGNKSFTELKSPQDGGYADLIDVSDYYFFVRELTERLTQDKFSVVVSSDGYGKAFSLLFNNLEKFQFSNEQIEKLQKLKQFYDQKFAVFENFPNTSFLLGENDANLYSLIHATLEADIIVIGFRNTLGMLLKIISLYSDRDNPPIIIELYKYRKPFDSKKLLGIDENKALIIPVKLEDFIWEDVIAKINKILIKKIEGKSK